MRLRKLPSVERIVEVVSAIEVGGMLNVELVAEVFVAPTPL